MDYDQNNGIGPEPEPPFNGSPKLPEWKQFDAFLRRELPKRLRTEFQSALEIMMGPLEETLKNQLEGIVRDCQDTLTRHFLDELNTSASAMEDSRESTDLTNMAGPSNSSSTQPSIGSTDFLSQFRIPPDFPEDWSDVMKSADLMNSLVSFDDSANFTLETAGPSERSLQSHSASFAAQSSSEDQQSLGPSSEIEAMPSSPVGYTGKGKEKAHFVEPEDDFNVLFWEH